MQHRSVGIGVSLIKNKQDFKHDSKDQLSRDVTELLSEVGEEIPEERYRQIDEDIPEEHYRQIGKRLADVSGLVLNAVEKDVGAVGELFRGTAHLPGAAVGELFWGTVQAIFKSVLLCVTAIGLDAYPARSTGIYLSKAPSN